MTDPVAAPASAPAPATAPSAAAPSPTAANAASNARVREAARQFEAVFVGQMAKLMLESVEQNEAFSGGHGEAMFRGVLAETLGGEIAKGPGIGLANRVMAELLRHQQGGAQ